MSADGSALDDELAERISVLTALCADPPEDADVAELAGLLGSSYLELYERDGSAETLDLAFDTFHVALSIAPEHADLMQWCFGLGMGFTHRATRFGDVGDYDLAISWFGRLHAGLLETDPDRWYAAALLMDAHWDRFHAIRYAESCDAATALSEAQRVVAAMRGLNVDGDAQMVAYARQMRGLAHLALFDESGDQTDLAAGIAELAAAFETITPDTPRYAFAGAWLIDAYRRRSELDGYPHELDLSIEAGARILNMCGPDDPAWYMLNGFQAMGYQARWRRTENPGDLDRAIAHWKIPIETDPDPFAAAQCGELMRQRAELLENAADLPEAIRLLGQAAQAAPAGDPEGWLRWFELAEAYNSQWRLTQNPDSLGFAAQCLDRSLEWQPPSSDATLLIHNQRVTVACAALKEEDKRLQTQPLPAAIRLRRCLIDAGNDLDRATTVMPDLRAMLATLLGYGEMFVAAFEMQDVDVDRIRDLITRGAQLSNPPRGWREITDGGLGFVQFAADAQNPRPGADGGVRELVAAAAGEQIGYITDVVRNVLPLAISVRAMRSGDLRGMRAAAALMEQPSPGESVWIHPDKQDRDSGVLTDLLLALKHGQQHDYAAVAESTERALSAMDCLQPSLPNDRSLRPMLLYLRAAALAALGRPVAIDPLPQLPARDTVTDRELGELALALGAQLSTAMAGPDMAALRSCTSMLAELAGRGRPGHPTRVMAVALAGTGELEVARRDPADRAAAARCAAWYEELVAEFGPDHPLWTTLALNLAEGLRRAGHPDRARTRQLGVSAIQAHGRRVMLQSGTDHAIESARAASADAFKVAGWCLQDRAFDDAVTTLDAGRGLVLRSATTSRQVADSLIQMGHHDLAGEWLNSAGAGHNQLTGEPLSLIAGAIEVPDDLRLRVLQALEITDSVNSPLALFTPIGANEIRTALATVGADALVYLVPASDSCPGTAVVIPVSGPVDTLDLPHLDSHTGSPISEYTQALKSRRDIDPQGSPGDGLAAQRLDAICRWAWPAAMQPLLDYARRWQLRRPARLVLVPMGPLALVPWHAAYADNSEGRRYAVQEIVLSYSVSARMFCTTAQHPLSQTQSALVVGDPQGNLPYAGLEAQAIHNQFYPSGHYLGRPADRANGMGTPDEVLDWLATTARGPSMLHFACHAHVDAKRPAEAHLILAGSTLTARRLLEVSRLAELVIDRVFLAACTTNVTGIDYDEAFSLATAFLAAGARTVFGSLWAVPDEDTSVLMYLVHHKLNAESCTPADALHQAQLWMLDPQRTAPDTMPPELRESFNRQRCADPLSWAAFTHLGR